MSNVEAEEWRELCRRAHNIIAKQQSEIERLRVGLTKQREAFDRLRPLCPDHRDKAKGHPCLLCEIERLRQRLDNAKEALQQLVDYQNGCPLPTYKKGWTAAMNKAHSVLSGGE